MIKPDIEKSYVVGDFKFINYIHLNKEQKLEVLNSRNQEIVREKMYKSGAISIEDQFQFIDGLVNHTDRSYWYIEYCGEYVGSYNITDYNEFDNSCESGVFFRYTDLVHMDQNIKMLKKAYDFSFNEMNINIMNGYTKASNLFMVNLILYFGFRQKSYSDIGYISVEMTKSDYIKKMRDRQFSMRDFIKYIKITKS